MPRIPRTVGRKTHPLPIADLAGCMASTLDLLEPRYKAPDRLAALRKGQEAQLSHRRLEAVFAELDSECP